MCAGDSSLNLEGQFAYRLSVLGEFYADEDSLLVIFLKVIFNITYENDTKSVLFLVVTVHNIAL